MSSVKYVLFSGCIALLSACGGGGKGSPGPSPIPSSTASVVSSSQLSSVSSSSVSSKSAVSKSSVSSSLSSAAFTVNAGADITVNAGEKITLNPNVELATGGLASFKAGDGNLELTTTSSKPDDIVSISWVLVEGPVVGLTMTSTSSALVSFIAPSLGAEKKVTMTYKLTVKKANGSKAEDTVTFTILRINQAPTVNTGADLTLEGLQTLTIKATAADSDGTIASYQWLQTSGANVALSGATTASLSFAAPSTNVELVLEFELTVTDNEGLSSKDKVSVTVKSENLPRVQLYFPAATGVYKGSTISVSGKVAAKDSSITGVTVDLGAGPVAAIVNIDGTWRVEAVPVPAGVAQFVVQVAATDSLGRVGKASATLQTAGDNAGIRAVGTATWGEVLGVAVDGDRNLAYVLAGGKFLKDVRLFSIDLANGYQSADISNFGDATKGIDATAIVAMTLDAEQQLIYYSTMPADLAIKPQIVSINTVTGVRKLVSDDKRGTGAALVKPTGLSIGANHILYVADNGSSSILAVDTVTGNRSVVGSALTADYAIAAPLHLAADINASSNRLFILPNASTNYVLQLNLALNPVVSSLVSDSGNNLQGTTGLYSGPKGIAYASSLNSLFIDDAISAIVKVDIASGIRSKFLATEWLESRIVYDNKRQLLYLVDGVAPGLFVVDPVTAQKVLISR